MITALTALGSALINGVTDYFKGKQKIRQAAQENRARLLQDQQTHNQNWEMAQLENAGWKDDVLFYFFIGLFIWAGFYPEQSAVFFQNVDQMPEWFKETWMWLVASVVGVRKLGDTLPALFKGVKDAVRG